MRRPALLVAALGALAIAVRRRSSAQRAERDVWTEATNRPAPDLR